MTTHQLALSYFLLLSSFCTYALPSQQPDFSSYDSMRVDSVFVKLNKDRSVSDEKIIKLKNLIRRSREMGYMKGEFNTLGTLGYMHGLLSDLDSMLYYFDQAEFMIQQGKVPQELIVSLYVKKAGCLISLFGLYENALDYLLRAYDLAQDVSDIEELHDIKVSIAQCYAGSSQYDQSIETLTDALADTTSLSDKAKELLFITFGMIYQRMEKPDGHIWNQKALKIAQRRGAEYSEWFFRNVISIDYHLMGLHEQALATALEVHDHFVAHPALFEHLLSDNEYLVGKYYYALGQNDLAIKFMTQSLGQSSMLQGTSDRYHELIQYYHKTSSPEKALEMYILRNVILDSMSKQENRVISSYAQSSLKLTEQRHASSVLLLENDVLEASLKRQRATIMAMIFVFISIALSLVAMSIFRKYRKGDKQIKVLKANERKLLEEQIKLRDDELLAIKMLTTKKMDSLEAIKNKLENASALGNEEAIKNIKEELLALINNSDELELLTERFQSRYPETIVRLRQQFPFLTPTDIKHCVLSKLGLSIKECANLLNVSTYAVKSARSRLKRKMDVDNEISLSSYISSICA